MLGGVNSITRIGALNVICLLRIEEATMTTLVDDHLFTTVIWSKLAWF
jgi:hypothetical protein